MYRAIAVTLCRVCALICCKHEHLGYGHTVALSQGAAIFNIYSS